VTTPEPSSEPVARYLLPDTAMIDASGELVVGGLRVIELARRFGTPLFIYDETTLLNRAREAVRCFGADRVVYATKAFLCQAMARLAHDEGLLLDVATGGELFVALSAGVPADRCMFHGNNKSLDELRYAITSGVRRIIVDSFDELDRLDALHREGLDAPSVHLRVTPGVMANTHRFVATGQDDSKFGFNVRTGAAMAAVERARGSASMNLLGIHVHVGSQVFAAENFALVAERVAAFSEPLGLPELTLGGGLGVAYTAGEQAPTIAQWSEVLLTEIDRRHISAAVLVEPGRSLVAQAGLTVYEVGTIKKIPGVRTYVSVDGGMSDNPRPVLYGSGYEAFVPARALSDRPERVRVVGKHCESGDVLLFEAQVPSGLQIGNLLATPVTGAYGYSMSSNYNKVTRPAVVFVRDGDARVVVRRETYEDLIRNDA
jgi:diaminopimelate decarboxylase